MRRKVFDMLASVGGVVVVIVLAVAGSLLMVGYSFANSYVHTQLAQQQITFPAAAAFAHPDGQEITTSMIPSVSQYAGQPLLTGQQAQVYANDFIAVHLQGIGGGKTYSQLSAAAMALPKGSAAYTAAEAKVQAVFQGTTLRGLLLEAYGFSLIADHRLLVCDCSLLSRRRHGGAGRPRLCPRPADGRERGASSEPHAAGDARQRIAQQSFCPVRCQHRSGSRAGVARPRPIDGELALRCASRPNGASRARLSSDERWGTRQAETERVTARRRGRKALVGNGRLGYRPLSRVALYLARSAIRVLRRVAWANDGGSQRGRWR